MSGLKGPKSVSVGNGTAQLFQVDDFRGGLISVQKDIILPSGVSLLKALSDLQKKVELQNDKIKELETKLDGLQIE